ncbi:hypothetical protein RND59_15085 [Vibrio ruber]|uniref:hypothetical protein n=1 Tax=Vibrio ruber TaxID=184755 RepID=UPI002892FA5F|nr:hypothetical protein [Vibrio ruber]WNJ95427.1 hypothetical protein RND59_15085 [Vibrio ruber]
MFRNLLTKLISWLKELWSLFEIIDEVVPAGAHFTSTKLKPNNTHIPSPQPTQDWTPVKPTIARHRYIELEGYAENFRIDNRGRYDLRQLIRFAENFVWISPDILDHFLEPSMDYDHDIVQGQRVTWLNKDDCIEFCYHQYSPLADLL